MYLRKNDIKTPYQVQHKHPHKTKQQPHNHSNKKKGRRSQGGAYSPPPPPFFRPNGVITGKARPREALPRAILTRWQGSRSPCRARTPFFFFLFSFFGHVRANGTVAQGESQGSPLSTCLLYTSPSPRDRQKSRMPSSA